ncbi:MAG: hypothetical protein Q4C64_07795 [Erysipelotrichia bacterium]|nr:hypothetical protein [Erysipelotrichia bacterium]
MRVIALDISSSLLATAVERSLKENELDFQVMRVNETELLKLGPKNNIYAVILEVLTVFPYKLTQRLSLIQKVKENLLQCKFVLLTDENDGQLTNSVKQAKKDNLIDNFVFTTVSPAYLAAVMDSL